MFRNLKGFNIGEYRYVFFLNGYVNFFFLWKFFLIIVSFLFLKCNFEFFFKYMFIFMIMMF